MRIVHVITGLGQGGAEGVLYRLTEATQRSLQHTVISLTDKGIYGDRMRALGIRIETLDMPRGRITCSGLKKLLLLMRELQPSVVQTWMYHADLIGGLVARWAGVKTIVWGIRNSTLDAKNSSLSSRIVARLCARLSPLIPAAIVSCSESAAILHIQKGYEARKIFVIPNGYNLDRFLPNSTLRSMMRDSLNIDETLFLIGSVARWDPQKDHKTLLHAISMLIEHNPHVRCVLIGKGMDRDNHLLLQMINQLHISDHVILLGPRDDIPAIMNAVDLNVVSSLYGEAFPNVIAEAMACGTPCVATDIGDASLIIGNDGWIVPVANPVALADAIVKAIRFLSDTQAADLKRRCRERIVLSFSMERMVNKYMAIWMTTANRHDL